MDRRENEIAEPHDKKYRDDSDADACEQSLPVLSCRGLASLFPALLDHPRAPLSAGWQNVRRQ